MSDLIPIVSVITPCYNQGQYVEAAIASVCDQTLQSWEVIVVNDGSTDSNTVERLETYERPNVTVLHTVNRGPSAARNTGIQHAKGRYILPLDADDRIAPTYLEKAVACLDADPTVGLVYSQAEMFGDQTGRLDLPPYRFPDILLGNMIFNSSLYRKADWETVGGYNENMVRGWEDYDFWLSLIELGREVVQIPEVLYFHRELANSRSQQLKQTDWVDCYRQIFHNHPHLYADHIETLFQNLVESRNDVQQTHARLREAQVAMQQTHARLQTTELEIHRLHTKLEELIIQDDQKRLMIAEMQGSKFWKLRDEWCKLRTRLGIPVPENPLLPPPSDSPLFVDLLPAKAVTKVKKLAQAWQERGTRGFLRFVAFRLATRFRQHTSYQQRIERDRLTKFDLIAADREIQKWQHRPVFSVILPVYNVDEKWLTKAIASVRNQIYPDWELCIADDASPAPHIKSLLTHYSKLDPRIKVVFRETNGNIVAASNSALELATGDYIALLDHDDELAISALFEAAKLINQHPEADFIYTDEDKIDPQGNRSDPFFKPDWSPDYFHSCMYTCHLGIYRTRLIREIGGFRPGYDGSQDYDLVLRVVENTQQIYHIPKVLYHWRIIPSSVTSGEDAKPWAYEAAQRALADMVNRSPYPGRVEPGPRAGFHRIRREIIGNPLISIVIPSAGTMVETPEGKQCGVETCIRSIRDRSTYGNVEIILVDGYDIPDPILEAVKGDDLRLVRCDQPFNFSQRINWGANAAQGEILLLLNDDMEVISPDWLESMLEFAQQSEIGAVGAKLFFPNNTIQHIGVMVLGGNPGHAFRGAAGDHPGYFCSNLVNRNYLAVTAACLMMRRSLFFDLGAMDETFPLNYNDVDLCLKAHQAGYRQVVTPYAQLFHYESASRKPGLRPKEWENLNNKWADYFKALDHNDPYYSPNLSRDEVNFEL